MSLAQYIPEGNKIVHYTSVDFAARYINAPVHLVQYDNGLPIIAVSLYLNGVPYVIPNDIDAANVRVAKTDNKYVYNPILGINNERNVVYIEVTRQMVAAYGDEYPIVELVKYANDIDQIVASGSFHAIVDANPVRDTNIESSSEYKTAKEFANKSQSYAVGGTGTREGEDSDNSLFYKNLALAYATNASTNANDAAMSAGNALASESRASVSEANAKTSETNASVSEANAKTSETNASVSEANAKTSETNASVSEANAKASENSAISNAGVATSMASEAKSWAVGGTGTRTGEDTDNSKWYAQKAKTDSETAVANAEISVTMANKAESYAVGGTNTRTGENTDNAKYYCESARASELSAIMSASNASTDAAIAKAGADAVTEALTPGSKLPRFAVNFVTGEVEYEGTSFVFTVNTASGDLEYELIA